MPHPCGRVLRVAQTGEAQGSDVGAFQEPGAVWIGWSVGRVAETRREAGGVVHDHYN